MPTAKQFRTLDISRRRVIGASLAVAGGALVAFGMTASEASAQTKMSQKSVQYRPKPKGQDRCNICTQWVWPSSCKIIDGDISPSGWCNLYASKS